MERRRVDTIALSLFFVAMAFIGLSFLISGIELRAHAVRTTATVLTVREIHDKGRGGGSHHEFTLEFTDRSGKPHTEVTEQVRTDPTPPGTGDRIAIYYASNDPSNLADVRFGSPGSSDFFMAAIFGCLVLTAPIAARLIRIAERRLRARRRRKLIAWPADHK